MGEQKTHRFKVGVGQIRNVLGLKGGFGMLSYWRTVFGKRAGNHPNVKPELEEDRNFEGFLKGTLWKLGLPETSVVRVDVIPVGTEVVLSTPIEFHSGQAHLPLKARRFLDRIGTMFYDLKNCRLTVYAVVRTGQDEAARQMLAVQRAATVARYLEDRFGAALGGIRCAGYAHGRYMEYLESDDAVVFVLRRASAPVDGAIAPR